MEPVLKFVNVNKYYNNNVHALHNINLEIAAGEFISVIGPSGSGKSTLLRTVNRLIDVSDGEIFLDGEDITSIGGKKLRAVRRKVGMIFQNYNLVYRLSVLQNVLHGYLGYLDGIKKKKSCVPSACLKKWAWAHSAITARPIYPAGRNSAWVLPGQLCSAQKSCWPMNRLPRLTLPVPKTSWIFWQGLLKSGR